MKLRREASLGLGALLGLQLALAGFAVALLTRMSPAIEHILEENVYSGEAVEQMLAELTLHADTPVEARERFDEALARARSNVTEDAEPALLDSIEAGADAAFAGDIAVRRQVADTLRHLAEVNRESMIRADERAQRLGRAGAWAAAILGASSLALGIVVYRRMRARLEVPIEAVRRCLHAARGGNWQARCVASDGPLEVRQIADDVNWLLDELRQRAHADTEATEPVARAALLAMLERCPGPAAVVDAQGHAVALNAAALDVVAATTGTSWDGWAVTPLGADGLRLAQREG